MPHGTEVGLGAGDIVLDGNPTSYAIGPLYVCQVLSSL